MGEWHVVQLVARVQNKEIDVVDCVNKSLLSDQEGEKTSWPRYVQMRVKQRVGNAPLSEQALCKAEMISIDVAKMGCQVKIECQDADGARQPIGWDFQAYCMPGFTIVSQETAEKPSLLLTLAPPQARGGNLSRQIASEQWVIGFEIQELLEE
ncbi:MAG: hypothetical protein RMJ84_07360 [Sandaracinaceae bacterium]|nr:hypothetical protein [Sandaracinaceae bacterium]